MKAKYETKHHNRTCLSTIDYDMRIKYVTYIKIYAKFDILPVHK